MDSLAFAEESCSLMFYPAWPNLTMRRMFPTRYREEVTTMEILDDKALGVAAVSLAEVPEDVLESVAGAGSGAYKTLGCCWCLPWYSSWTKCGLVCPAQRC